ALSQWGRDAVALALPDKILCRPDCAGLCGECGKNLNDEPHTHDDAEPDPRWAALAGELLAHADDPEPAAPVERHRRLVSGEDARLDRPDVGALRLADELGEQRAADAPAAGAARAVDRVLG